MELEELQEITKDLTEEVKNLTTAHQTEVKWKAVYLKKNHFSSTL